MDNEQWIPENKDELLSAIRHEWDALMKVVAKLDERKMLAPDEGGWSPKDNLAHIGEWMNIMLGYHIEGRLRHEVMKLGAENATLTDYDAINRILFEHHRNQSSAEVLNELKSIYARVMEKLNAMTFDQIMVPRFENDPEKKPLLIWITGNTTEHFAEHRETIEKML